MGQGNRSEAEFGDRPRSEDRLPIAGLTLGRVLQIPGVLMNI
jgi:hypothetical protein